MPPRLKWLLMAMMAAGVLRALAPSPDSSVPTPVAEAIVRKPPTAAHAYSGPAKGPALTPPIDLRDDPGNAFSVRTPVAPATATPERKPVKVPAPALETISPIESSEPAMPYRVIGTWDDATGPGVFLASPTGTLLARRGTVLQAEYQVTSITPAQISLLRLSTRREVQLAVSRPPETPRPIP